MDEYPSAARPPRELVQAVDFNPSIMPDFLRQFFSSDERCQEILADACAPDAREEEPSVSEVDLTGPADEDEEDDAVVVVLTDSSDAEGGDPALDGQAAAAPQGAPHQSLYPWWHEATALNSRISSYSAEQAAAARIAAARVDAARAAINDAAMQGDDDALPGAYSSFAAAVRVHAVVQPPSTHGLTPKQKKQLLKRQKALAFPKLKKEQQRQHATALQNEWAALARAVAAQQLPRGVVAPVADAS